MKKKQTRKKVGKYKEKEKYRENLKAFYDKKIKEWQTI
jgi:hypothetical protein|tara:strand:- start:240 stop:353 length:114 start_codon:yes stop_codon:yes gene_type:complete